jgi:selenocysteine-specific elongation factor
MLSYSSDPDAHRVLTSRLRVFKRKSRVGAVERMHDADTVIVRGLFKKETQLDLFTGLAVTLATGERGSIEGGFGQSGKVRVRCMGGLLPETQAKLRGTKKGEDPNIAVTLDFKRYVFDEAKKMVQ